MSSLSLLLAAFVAADVHEITVQQIAGVGGNGDLTQSVVAGDGARRVRVLRGSGRVGDLRTEKQDEMDNERPFATLVDYASIDNGGSDSLQVTSRFNDMLGELDMQGTHSPFASFAQHTKIFPHVRARSVEDAEVQLATDALPLLGQVLGAELEERQPIVSNRPIRSWRQGGSLGMNFDDDIMMRSIGMDQHPTESGLVMDLGNGPVLSLLVNDDKHSQHEIGAGRVDETAADINSELPLPPVSGPSEVPSWLKDIVPANCLEDMKLQCPDALSQDEHRSDMAAACIDYLQETALDAISEPCKMEVESRPSRVETSTLDIERSTNGALEYIKETGFLAKLTKSSSGSASVGDGKSSSDVLATSDKLYVGPLAIPSTHHDATEDSTSQLQGDSNSALAIDAARHDSMQVPLEASGIGLEQLSSPSDSLYARFSAFLSSVQHQAANIFAGW